MLHHDIISFRNALTRGRTILGIDYGTKKIGIAVSSHNLSFALPLTIIDIKVSDPIIEIKKLIVQHNVCGLVIGLPVKMDGLFGESTEVVNLFAQRLEDQLDNQHLYLQDERLTSKAADNLLKSAGFNRLQRVKRDDSIAASLILDTVLNVIANLAK